MLCCRSLHGSSKTPQPHDASVTICTRVYIGVYAALLHGFSHLPSVVSSAPDVAASASRVQLDSPWFAAPRGQSSCRVQFAVSSSVRPELRERLGVDDIALALQQNRLRWYGHVLRKDDDDWVKKCMEDEVEGSRPRGRPKKTWKEVVRDDCQARKLNKEDAVDRCKWRKVIKEAR